MQPFKFGNGLFHLTLYRACDYLSMLGLKLIHVSNRGHWGIWLSFNMLSFQSCGMIQHANTHFMFLYNNLGCKELTFPISNNSLIPASLMSRIPWVSQSASAAPSAATSQHPDEQTGAMATLASLACISNHISAAADEGAGQACQTNPPWHTLIRKMGNLLWPTKI